MIMGSGGSSSSSRKFTSMAVLSVSFFFLCFLLLVASLADRNYGRGINVITTAPSATNVKISKPLETTEKSNLDYVVVSKRRVPNGPDPIHNRRVGDSKLPPT
ncbi:hypothetical protein ABFS82_08G018300 [Erythranthe guttata]|uniref:uncharacterized protein LOC105961704 n=1 Tax=Erythranthe guttata TaxID=4155 RepID=UPI00064DF2C5|nr:PREDICTED: uncharacterized protein LOC105961704 [Erythranthe guttata]|eukprot:XP_012841413.1 PREDICTED: uncharacterized protein LOC105961704 [Erythranthe guttata]